MKKIKKLAAFILAAALLITGFSGCGKTEAGKSDMPEFIYVPTYNKLSLPEGVEWLGSVKYVDGKFYAVADSYREKETVNEETGEIYTESLYVQKLLSFDEDGKNFAEVGAFGMDNHWDENGGMNEYINGIIKTPEGLAVLTSRNTTSYDLPAGFNPETGNRWEYEKTKSEYLIYPIGEDGAAGEGTVLFVNESSQEDYFYPNYFLIGGNGNWYIGSWEEIRVYDKDFNQLYSIDCSVNGVNGMITLKDGSVGCAMWTENGIQLKVIDDSKKDFGESYDLPQNVYSFAEGNGVYDFIYASGNGSGLGAFDTAKGEGETLLYWLDSDVDSNGVYPERVFVKDEENLIAFEETWNDEGTVYNIIDLKKTPSSEVPEKKIITLGCIYMDYNIRQDVLEFNKTNGEYRIRVTDYSEYASGEDYYGLTKLNTEIISGNVPDIFITSNMPMDKYAGKGIFEDLMPYIEKTIGWDNLVQAPFKALMNDEGKLYEIHESFGIRSYVGLKNVVGDGSSWTFDDLKEAFAKLPEGASVFGEDMTKAGAFSLLFSNNVASFVDWEKGECNFTGEEFIDILEFTENFPLEFEYTDEFYNYYVQPIIKVAKGEMLLSAASVYNIQNMRAQNFYILGDQTSFVGLPTNEGSGNAFYLNAGFAMSSTCEYKDAVWEFISRILTEEHQKKEHYYQLPTNKAIFDEMMEKEMTPEFDEFYNPEESLYPEYAVDMPAVETNPAIGYDIPVAETPAMPGGEGKEEVSSFTLPEFVKGQVNEKGWHELPKTYGWAENGGQYFEFPVYAMTQAEYDAIMELINSTTKISRYDESVMNIVNEEIEYFFNGDRTAQQTAEYIQSRVNLYVNEQR